MFRSLRPGLQRRFKMDLYKKDFTGLEIPEVPHTYAYHHGMFGYLNENRWQLENQPSDSSQTGKSDTYSGL